MVPFERNLLFASRESELRAIRQALYTGDQTVKVTITGLGGVGKTQLALELACRVRVEHKSFSVIWIPVTSKESFAQAYLSAAKVLGIPGCEHEKADVNSLVRDHLGNEGTGQWLLIFDNADDIDLWLGKSGSESDSLIDKLPKSRYGSIIFTMCDKAAGKLAGRGVFEISEIGEAGGMQVLQNHIIDRAILNDEGAVAALLSRLTYLPLAIV